MFLGCSRKVEYPGRSMHNWREHSSSRQKMDGFEPRIFFRSAEKAIKHNKWSLPDFMISYFTHINVKKNYLLPLSYTMVMICVFWSRWFIHSVQHFMLWCWLPCWQNFPPELFISAAPPGNNGPLSWFLDECSPWLSVLNFPTTICVTCLV